MRYNAVSIREYAPCSTSDTMCTSGRWLRHRKMNEVPVKLYDSSANTCTSRKIKAAVKDAERDIEIEREREREREIEL